MIINLTDRALPQSWGMAKLGSVGSWSGGSTPSKSNSEFWRKGTIPWVTPKDMKVAVIYDAKDRISTAALKKTSISLIPADSVLIVTRSGILSHTLPVAVNKQPVTVNQDLKAITPENGMDSHYIGWFCRAFANDILTTCSKKGTTVSSINTEDLKAFHIPIPPQQEQRRIVVKIEEFFSELDKGIESLQTARAQLKTFRQSLLKAAFEGRLTEQWRRENADKFETADQLLARIRKEREARYQQQLEEWKAEVEKWEAEGKRGKKPTKPSLPKVEATDTIDDVENQFASLPDGWAWIRLGNAAVESVLGKMLDKKKNRGTLKPYLRNINVRWGRFDLDDLLEMRFESHEQNRYGLADEDLVICEGGEPGRCAVWKNSFGDDMRIQKALHRVRLPKNSVLIEYVQIYLEYAAMTQRLERYMTGTTIKHLTGKGLNQVPIPVCSVEEQRVILELLSARFSNIDHTDRNIGITLQQAETLRKSILKRAFEGRLVPQDPDDEPAAELLARIRAERKDQGPKSGEKKRRKKVMA